MERKGGIILVRMHTNGGPAIWSRPLRRALGQAWQVIGNDPENEVMILTATNPAWLLKPDEKDEDVDITGVRGYDLNYDEIDTLRLLYQFSVAMQLDIAGFMEVRALGDDKKAVQSRPEGLRKAVEFGKKFADALKV